MVIINETQQLVQIDVVKIENADEIKNVGVIMDPNLIWKACISHRTTKSLTIINKAKHILEFSVYLVHFAVL